MKEPGISISRDGIEIGEWTETEVRGFYQEGRLVDTDCYWTEGMTQWTPLSRLIRPPPPFPSTSPKEPASSVPAEDLPVAPHPFVKRLAMLPKESASTVPSEELPVDLSSVESLQVASLSVTPLSETRTRLSTTIPDHPEYPGIGRILFLFLNVLIIAVAIIIKNAKNVPMSHLSPIDICMSLALMGPIAARLINIGYSGWYCLLSLIPIVGFFVNIFCYLKPPGYAVTKKHDTGTWIACACLGLLFLGFIVLIILGISVKPVYAPPKGDPSVNPSGSTSSLTDVSAAQLALKVTHSPPLLRLHW